jgi:hypothetical protein
MQGGIGRLMRSATGMFARIPGFGHGSSLSTERDSAELERRVTVPILAESSEAAERREIERGFATLADEGLWLSLLDRIRGVDQTRQTFASGHRYFDCALAGALTPVTRHLGPKPKYDAATACLPELQALHASDTRDHMPAVLLARAKIEIAWSLLGTREPGRAPEQAARSAAIQFESAESAIEGYDPIETNSPMVAEARYLLAPGLDNGGIYLRDWYEDWADLDPSNPNMLATHSRLLMPDRFGTLDEIEREARRAIIRADDGLGIGAYALFWRKPLEIDAGAISHLDPDLFVESILSVLSRYPSQMLTNEFAALLYSLALPRTTESRAVAARNAPIRERLDAGYDQIIREHLKELHAQVWGLSKVSMLLAVAEAMPNEFNSGAILRPGDVGIEAVDEDQGSDDEVA